MNILEVKQIPDHIQQWYKREPEGWFGSGQYQHKEKLEQLAQYSYRLIAIFENNKEVKNSEQYQLLKRLFNERCEVTDKAAIKIKKKTKGDSLQSAYDPEASYGYKGSGYSTHITETCNNSENEIITDYEVL